MDETQVIQVFWKKIIHQQARFLALSDGSENDNCRKSFLVVKTLVRQRKIEILDWFSIPYSGPSLLSLLSPISCSIPLSLPWDTSDTWALSCSSFWGQKFPCPAFWDPTSHIRHIRPVCILIHFFRLSHVTNRSTRLKKTKKNIPLGWQRFFFVLNTTNSHDGWLHMICHLRGFFT